MDKYEISFSFSKKGAFVFLIMYLFFYGVFNFVSLFLKDIFTLMFK
jgi:hypothetical protein